MPGNTIIVFHELLEKFPNLQGDLGSLGWVCHSVEGGRRALEQAQQMAPALLLLDVAMPEMSGIECCRQIKEGAFSTPPKIILVSSLASSSIEQRAEDAGCDRYILEADASHDLVGMLSEVLGQSAKPSVPPSAPMSSAAPSMDLETGASVGASVPLTERRVAPRIEIPGPILYTTSEDTFQGEMMNLSLTGLLFASSHDVPVGSPLTLRFRSVRGEEFELSTKVVRTVGLKVPRNGLTFGVGATFERRQAEDGEKINWLLDARLDLKLPQFPPDELRSFLEGNEDLIGPYMRGEQASEKMAIIVGQWTEFEAAAFAKEDPQANCVRRLVFMRAQFRAFRAFVPILAKSPGTFAGIFLPFLPVIFERAAAIEEESNSLVREAVELGDEAGRVGLNQTSNTLYDARVALICAIADQVSSEGLGEQGELVKRMKEEALRLRSRQKDEFDQKYARRAPVPEPKEEDKESEFIKSLSSKKTWVLTSIFFLVVGLGVGGYLLSQRVAPEALKLPIGVSSITKVYNGIDVTIDYQVWVNWPQEDQDLMFQKLEEYMAENRYKQAKILDESGKRIAIIMGTKYGKDWVFNRRFY